MHWDAPTAGSPEDKSSIACRYSFTPWLKLTSRSGETSGIGTDVDTTLRYGLASV